VEELGCRLANLVHAGKTSSRDTYFFDFYTHSTDCTDISVDVIDIEKSG
jgi:hypothetical protein